MNLRKTQGTEYIESLASQCTQDELIGMAMSLGVDAKTSLDKTQLAMTILNALPSPLMKSH